MFCSTNTMKSKGLYRSVSSSSDSGKSDSSGCSCREREGRKGYFAGWLAAAEDHGEVAKRIGSDHEAIEEKGIVALGDASH